MDAKGKKIRKNIWSGLLYQTVILVMGFLLPRLYLEQFGSEVNGVLSTIKQIFSYLCLLEAGVGLATTQALYGPVASSQQKKISSVLAATSSYYIRTGVIYTAAVLLISLVYALFAKTEVGPVVLFVLILLNAVPTLFSYFVQAKYKILMEVDGRKYVISNSETVLHLVSNLGKILAVLLFRSLILMQTVYCLLSLAQLIYLYFYARKQYPWLDFEEKPDFEAISQKESVLVHQISAMVFNNTDVLLISTLCDFAVASVYAVYNLFFAQVQTLITHIVSGFSFALGQLFQSDRDRFLRLFRIYETYYVGATYLIYTLMAVFLLPLIQIYTGGIEDAAYTNPLLLLLFVLTQLLANGKLPVNHALEFSGHFRDTRSHALWEMGINLSVSVVAVWRFGICGALAGTVVALLYRNIVMLRFVNKTVLQRSVWKSVLPIGVNGALFGFVMALFYTDSFVGYSFGRLVLVGVGHALWIVPLFVGVNGILCPDGVKLLWSRLCRKEEA